MNTWIAVLVVNTIFIDRKAREIMYLVASVRPLPLSWLNHLTYDLHLLHGGRP